ncbi:conserved hypothetical protein [Methanocaldococcus jannaschii DSM 2661]|uniref:Uncharacterized protein MJ1155.1 n=1 Tax=Methanocaldococcus jannaschii (strain ATCC 43067 / DSM 2661 / JAL-1 / JCM 10045 / NBRC 100440) TaxID=243232 RepID=YB5A_METJA|nr:AzlD domain-containing protein [Methanocaldococcus jannaschii]P81316.1 RecName: Full=Uncharacterized protein MJ1155.1 [Methanocaldococcus jannaschii DSM 2661]AAB99154.1 conserved hypothetical protein [Methanocaldococcus jannaschii DSM 2661]
MDKNILAIIFVAVGTYLIRYIPIHLHSKIKNIDEKVKEINEILIYSSTSVISALFITSFIKFPIIFSNVLISTISLIFAIVSYKKWNNLGISILISVVIYYLASKFLISI